MSPNVDATPQLLTSTLCDYPVALPKPVKSESPQQSAGPQVFHKWLAEKKLEFFHQLRASRFHEKQGFVEHLQTGTLINSGEMSLSLV